MEKKSRFFVQFRARLRSTQMTTPLTRMGKNQGKTDVRTALSGKTHKKPAGIGQRESRVDCWISRFRAK